MSDDAQRGLGADREGRGPAADGEAFSGEEGSGKTSEFVLTATALVDPEAMAAAARAAGGRGLGDDFSITAAHVRHESSPSDEIELDGGVDFGDGDGDFDEEDGLDDEQLAEEEQIFTELQSQPAPEDSWAADNAPAADSWAAEKAPTADPALTVPIPTGMLGPPAGHQVASDLTGELPIIVDAAHEMRELAAAARRELDATDDDGKRARIHRALGVLFEQRVGDQRRALRHYQEAYRIDPEDLVAIQGARRIFWTRENWTMVLSLLDAEVRLCASERRAADLLCVRGQVYAERLANHEAARGAFQAALERDAGAIFALVQLRGIHRDSGDDAALLSVCREAASAVQDPRQRSLIYVEIARAQERGGRVDEAIESYSAAFAEDPRSAAATTALMRLYREVGRFGDLVDVLLTIGDLGEPRQQALCYVAAARLCRDRLDQRDRALELLTRAREQHSDPLLLSEMAELLGQAGRYDELARVLAELQGALVDRGERVVAHHRLGRLYEAHIGDDDAAIAEYRAALSLEPTYVPALQALGRQLAQREAWEELGAMQLAEAESLPEGPTRARRLAAIGELFERRLGDSERALELHERALKIDPDAPLARRALERLYASSGRYAALLELNERDVQDLGDGGAAARADDGGKGAAIGDQLTRMAMIAELALRDPSRAVELYERALQARGDDLGTLRALARLYAELGRVSELAEVLEREAALIGDERVELALRYRVAELCERLGRRDEALARYREIVERDASHTEAASALGRLYERRGEFEALRDLYRAQLGSDDSSDAAGNERRAMLLYKRGELEEERLADIDSAIECFQAALLAAPGFRPALQALARLYRRSGDWGALADVLEQRAEGVVDPVERAGLYFALGELAEGRLAAPERALSYYRRAFELAPSHDPSREALIRLLLGAGSAGEAADVCERGLEAASETSVRVALYKRLAEIFESQLREPERAARALEMALDLDAEDVEALDGLARLSRANHAWAAAADALGRLAAVTDDMALAVALLREAAELVEAHLHGDLDPVPYYQRIAELARGDRVALEALWRLHLSRRDVGGLAEVVTRLLAIERDAQPRAALLLSLAVALEEQADLAGACAAFDEAAELEGAWLVTRELRRAQSRLGRWLEAGESLAHEAELGSDTTLAVQALLEAAHIHHEHGGDASRVAGALERVLEIDPYHDDAARWLEQVLVKHEEWHRLADVARRRLRRGAADPDKSRQRIELIARLSWIEREHLGNAVEAAKTLEEAVRIDPHHLPTLLTLGELYVALEQWTEAAETYGRVVALSDDPDLLRRAHFELGEIYSTRLGDKRKAISSFQNVLAISVDDAPAMERLRELFVQGGDWDNAADMLERLRDAEPDAEQRKRHAVALADIQEREFGDPQMAVRQLTEALHGAPDDDEIVDRLVELCGRLGQWDSAARALSRHIAALPSDARSRVRRRRLELAELLHQRLSRPDDALVELQRAAESDPGDLDVRARVARLLAKRGDVERALREHHAILETDPLLAPPHLESLRQLRAIYQQTGDLARAYPPAAVLARIGAGGEADERLARELRPKTMLAPPAHYEADELERRLRDPEEHSLAGAIVAALGECAHRLRPPPLAHWQVGKADRLPPRSEDPLKVAVREVREALQLTRDVEVYVSGTRTHEMDLLLTDPPAIVAGSGLVSALPSWQLRTWITQLLSWVRSRNWVAYGLSARELAVMVHGASRVFEPDLVDAQLPPGEMAHQAAEMSRLIQRSMSRKTRRALEEAVVAFQQQPPPQFERWMWAMRRTAMRTMLWMSGDFDSVWTHIAHYLPKEQGGAPQIAKLERDGAVAAIAAELSRYPLLVSLIRFWLSDELRSLRS
ncbi:MAG: tetratricopeptide repeat protein [Myxococcales bacterium]|nr:tetratricopeptide repeat protein [Myxococcales bacterium]